MIVIDLRGVHGIVQNNELTSTIKIKLKLKS